MGKIIDLDKIRTRYSRAIIGRFDPNGTKCPIVNFFTKKKKLKVKIRNNRFY